MSPSCSTRLSGMPWQMTSLTLVHTLFGIAVVVERAGVGAALDGGLVDEHVDLVGGDAGADDLAGQAQDLGRHDAGVAHALDDVGRLHPRLGPSRCLAGGRVGRAFDVVGHAAHGADLALQHPTLEGLVAALVLAATAAPAGVVGLGQHGGGLSLTSTSGF